MTIKNKISKAAKVIILGIIFAFALALNTSWTSVPVNHNGHSVFITQTYAADDAAKPAEAFNPQDLINKVAEYATYVHRFFYPLINFFAFHTGDFLGTDYIYAGSMGDMLNKIWIVSRNIVNIVFVLILLFLAIKEIFFIKEEGTGELKKHLIRLTLLLVAVNFSWLATKVVLDTANVATNIVFALPTGVASAGIEKIIDQKCDVNPEVVQPDGTKKKMTNTTSGSCMPTGIYAPVSSDTSKKYQYLSEEECNKDGGIDKKYQGAADSAFDAKGDINTTLKDADPNKQYQDMTTYCWGSINFFNYNKNTSAIYLVYGMARIQNLVNSSADESVVQLSVGILFSLLIQVAYLLALAALFIALILRMAMLWLFVAFSPFLVLLMYFGGQGGAGSAVTDKFSVKEFINWAFVPTMVGAVFSVAFIMLAAGQSITGKDPTFLQQGGMTLGTKLFKFKTLFMGMDTIQEFIWLVMVLVVLWMGVFAILGKLKVGQKVFSKNNEWGQSGATFLAKLPYYAPVIPMVNKKGDVEFGSLSEKFKPIGDLIKEAKKFEGDHGGAGMANAEEKAKNMTKQDKDKILKIQVSGELKGADDIARMYGYSSAKEMWSSSGGDPGMKKLLEETGGDGFGEKNADVLGFMKRAAEKEKTKEEAAARAAKSAEEDKKKQATGGAASAPAAPPAPDVGSAGGATKGSTGAGGKSVNPSGEHK